MPFEQYVNYTAPDHTQASQRTQEHPVPSSYQNYASSSREDPYGYDPTIFSANVQFQVPQLMLGPTLAPGGGAEVLPAGIVNRPDTVSSAWFTAPPAFRSPCSGDDLTRWLLPESDSSTLSNALSDSPVLKQSQQSTTSRGSSGEPSFATQQSFSELAANARAVIASSVHAPRPMSAVPVSFSYVMPPVGGLPVYSSTGFDILGLLARVTTRPHPKIVLGPVDLTCSFTVVDVRRYDHPIVYASPTFCRLTGYTEQEVIGRNCRFLQAPDGQVQKGEPRRHTAQDAVALLRRSLVADKECQVSLVNYRKNGSAFINLITVIPVPGGVNNSPSEAEDVVYQIGFQVDLTEQPNAILQRLRDGSYMVNYSSNVIYPTQTTSKDWKANSASNAGVSKQFRAVLNNPDFLASIPISVATTTLSLSSGEKGDLYDGNRLVSLLLLEKSPDFVVVLSLKGAFLYVSPSVSYVLGYDPEHLVGKSVTDYCHEADKVPLIRELKESSVAGPITPSINLSSNTPAQGDDEERSAPPSSSGSRGVDLLFRMRGRDGNFIWMECSGRLFAEPGKGRKAIILSGRARDVPCLKWQALALAGGLAQSDGGTSRGGQDRECWALLSLGGSFLHASTAVRDVLGWGAAEVIGRPVTDFVAGQGSEDIVRETLEKAYNDPTLESRSLSCRLKKKDGSEVRGEIVLYHPSSSVGSVTIAVPPLVCQIRLSDHSTQPPTFSTMVHPHGEDVFAELHTTRGSGWQYELQQLKFENQQLEKEVEELEEQVKLRQAQQQTQDSYRRRLSYAYSSATDWAQHLMGHQSLKRSWDGNHVGHRGAT